MFDGTVVCKLPYIQSGILYARNAEDVLVKHVLCHSWFNLGRTQDLKVKVNSLNITTVLIRLFIILVS
jgi:hypothetical protein